MMAERQTLLGALPLPRHSAPVPVKSKSALPSSRIVISSWIRVPLSSLSVALRVRAGGNVE
jgi:hypothetical protein